MKRPTREQIGGLIALCNQGKLNEALPYGEALAKEFPEVSLIRNLLGAVNFSLGRVDEAVEDYRRALEIKPDYAQAQNNLGIALHQLGKHEEAVESYRKSLELQPDLAEAHVNLGNALAQLGRWEEVVASFGKALELAPGDAETHINLGHSLAHLSRFEEAVANYIKSLAIKPDLVEAHNSLGNALYRLGRFEESAASYAKAIELVPADAEAHNNHGSALAQLRRQREAIASFKKSLELKPDYAKAHFNLGNALDYLGRWDEAIGSFKQALEIEPTNVEAHNNLGSALDQLDRSEEAIASFDRALELKPDYCEAHNNRGLVFARLGKNEEAIAAYTKAVEIRPDYSLAHLNLSTLKTYQPDDPHIVHMRAQLERDDVSDEDRMRLDFALGKAYAEIGEFDKAFASYAEGNRLRKQELNYDISFDRQKYEKLVTRFSQDVPGLDISGQDGGTDGRQVIFVLGMTRSGTTLVEQILASHSQVYGAGELELLPRAVDSIDWESSELSVGQLESVRKEYRSGLERFGSGEPFITDKMPFNFWWIGFICTALPEAKIVHVRRDARAVCWSNYKHFFPSDGVGFTNDFKDLASYYRIYLDLMAFWHDKFPGRIYDLEYEVLTENQEPETRRLLQYAGLDWEDRCLEFYKTERAVRTVSAKQVRQEMYQGSSDEWRNYEVHLAPLIGTLKHE